MEHFGINLIPNPQDPKFHLLRLTGLSPEEADQMGQETFEDILDRGIETLFQAKFKSRENPEFRKTLLDVSQIN
jgi:hypothetical protein